MNPCGSPALVSLSNLKLPGRQVLLSGNDEPAVVPVKEPTTVPVEPDVVPEPNTIPYRPAVPEPDVAPCERPDTTCPVHR